MTQFKIILLICFVTGFTATFGQNDDSGSDDNELQILNQIRIINTESPVSNEILLVQKGDLNEAYVQQVNSSSNSVESYQLGTANLININQEGNLYSILVVQAGDYNRYGADIEGYDANLNIFQVGSYNSIGQTSVINNANLTIIQIGDGHELIQERDISNTQGMRIIQRGNGAKAIIR